MTAWGAATPPTAGLVRPARRYVPELPGFIALLLLFLPLWWSLNTEATLELGDDPGPLHLFRALLRPLVGVAAVLALLVAYRRGGRVRAPWPLVALAAYALVGLAAALLVSPNRVVGVAWGIAYVAVPLAGIALSNLHARSNRARDALRMTWIIVGSLAVTFFVLAIAHEGLLTRIGAGSFARIYPGRSEYLPGLLITSNGVGRFGAIAALLAVSRLLQPGRGRRVLWGSLSAVGTILLVYTVSRTALLGFGAALVLLVALHRGWRWRVALVTGALVLCAVYLFREPLSVYLMKYQTPGPFWDLSQRRALWEQAVALAPYSPYVGFGFHADRLFMTEAVHNAWLLALLQAGGVGLALFVAAWVLAWIRLARLGLFRRFVTLAPADRGRVIDVTAVLAFLAVRSVFESTGASFGVDLLLLVPMIAYVHALPLSSDSAALPDARPADQTRLRILSALYDPASPDGVRGSLHDGPFGPGVWRSVARRHEIHVLVPGHSLSKAHEEGASGARRIVTHAVDVPGWLQAVPGCRVGSRTHALLWSAEVLLAAATMHGRHRFDVFHDVPGGNPSLGGLAGHLLGIPSMHGPDRGPPQRASGRPGATRSVRNPFAFAAGEYSARILVPTVEALDAMPTRWRRKTIVFPSHALPSQDLAMSRAARHGKEFRVVAGGGPGSVGRPDIAVWAVARLAREDPRVALLLPEICPEPTRLAALAQHLGIGDRVAFVPWSPRGERLRLIGGADVFLAAGGPGDGQDVVEAMGQGVAVVASGAHWRSVPFTRECGILVPPADDDIAVRNVAESLRILHRNPDVLAAMGRAARRRAEQYHRSDVLAARLCRVYEEAAAHRGKALYDGVLTPGGPADGRPTFEVLGTRLDAATLSSALAFFERCIREGRRAHACSCTVNMIMTARRDPLLREALETADFVITDGMPLVRIGRRRTTAPVDRIRAADLVDAFSGLAARGGYRCYFYGGAPGVAAAMARALEERHPGLKVVGTYAPPFRPLTAEEDSQVVAAINGAKPDMLWVGLGCPKQERWMLSHRGRVSVPVMVGVGAAFDFLAGSKRAPPPRWVANFEWLWRFSEEPRRLWRRVLIEGPQFLVLAAIEDVRVRLRGPGGRGSGHI